jgi:hypothetical protein
MPTAPGYAAISVQLQHAGLSRAAYLTFGTNPTATDPFVVATEIATALGVSPGLKTTIDSNVTITNIRVSLGTDGTVDIVGAFGVSIACTLSGASLPPNNAVLVHKQTARGGRRGRGRLFLPWAIVNTATDEAGLIATGSVTTLQTAMTAFHSALGANNNPMVLLHDPGVTAAGAPDVVTNLVVDQLISTQRRRLGRR